MRRAVRPAGLGPARQNVDPALQRDGAEPVAWRRHRGQRRPAVRGRVVDLHLAEGPAGRLAAEDEQPAAENGRRDPASRRRQGRGRGPAVGRGIVHVMGVEVSRIATIQATAHDVELAADDPGRVVIPGHGHRRARLPAVRHRIVHLEGVRVASVGPHAARGVDAPVQHGGGQRTPRRGERRPGPPPVRARVVLEQGVLHGPLAAGVAADNVEPRANSDGRRVVKRRGQRRPPLPAVRARVVDLDQIAPLPEAADHVEAPAELRPGHLRAARQERRRAGPGAGALAEAGRRERDNRGNERGRLDRP